MNGLETRYLKYNHKLELLWARYSIMIIKEIQTFEFCGEKGENILEYHVIFPTST